MTTALTPEQRKAFLEWANNSGFDVAYAILDNGDLFMHNPMTRDLAAAYLAGLGHGQQRIEALEAELAACKRDAERWQKLMQRVGSTLDCEYPHGARFTVRLPVPVTDLMFGDIALHFAQALDTEDMAPGNSVCPKCDSEEWDLVSAERGRERDVPFNRCNKCQNEWSAP